MNIELLEETFAALSDEAEELVARFYEELFERFPGVKPLFKDSEINEQKKKLLSALVLVVNNLRKPDVLEGALKDLGRRHKEYGALPEHYPAVAETLLDVMQEFAGELWTDEVEQAWSEALNQVAEIMLSEYEEPEANEMGTNSDNEDYQALKEELTKMKSAVGNTMTAIMMVDRDLVVTYVNEATISLLKTHEHALSSLYPGFAADKIVGSCIDMFHKDPQHQRRLLNDPKNLPHSADIQVGTLIFNINVTAQFNEENEYCGNTLEWYDVTEQRKQETNVARLQVAVDGAQTPMIMIDRDFIITYANNSTIELLRKYESKFREVWPSFSVDGVMGVCIDMFHKDPSHQRKLLADPNNLPYKTDIEINGLKFALTVSAQKDVEGNYIGNTLEWEDVTEQRAKDLEVARLQSAVDGAEANLMLCDQDLNITYANPAVVAMLANRQTELRQIWPSLDVNNLIGQCIDQFHKNPSHQRQLLADVSRLPASAEIKVGGLEFSVNATAILDHEGQYMGNMVQWNDITEQKDAERQIQNLIDAASVGQLDERIKAEEYQGFMRGLAEGINRMMDTVVQPIRETKRVVEALAKGDLTETASGDFEGEFSVLLEAVNSSMSNLLNMVNEIRSTSTNINTSASEIAQGNADLSQRTEEQASSLEETASSIEELTGTVKQNADNARQANQLADSAREQAEKGGEVVGNAIGAMGEINQSSKKIADIIGVIDEIAFQTNLLALNAAVEAARAGEQGRGFAVVASEVRNLAQRSAEAAKEIKTLINDSVQKVEEGSRLVDESGTTLEEIVNSVKKVNDIIAEIAAASEEQSAGIEQVNKAVTQMDQMTQQNAALVEEAAAASESMDEQSKGLSKLMEYFDVGDSGAAPVASTAQTERRAEDRPWSKSEAPVKQESVAASKPVKKAASGGAADSEWEEF